MKLLALMVSTNLAVQFYTLIPESIAVLKHVNAPFTQGLTTLLTDQCDREDLASYLDDCLGNQPYGKKRARCYETALSKCIALYESSGLYGKSYIRKVVDFKSGKSAQQLDLPSRVFVEGMDVLDPNAKTLIAGSWREKRLFILQDTTNGLTWIDEIAISSIPEHWGLATSDTHIWFTDGGTRLYEYDLPLHADFTQDQLKHLQRRPDRVVEFTCKGRRVRKVNELAYDPQRDLLWGNVWLRSEVFAFNVTTGQCVGVLDLDQNSKLVSLVAPARKADSNAVWNGIDILGGRWILFTGKLFDHMFIAKYTV